MRWLQILPVTPVRRNIEHNKLQELKLVMARLITSYQISQQNTSVVRIIFTKYSTKGEKLALFQYLLFFDNQCVH